MFKSLYAVLKFFVQMIWLDLSIDITQLFKYSREVEILIDLAHKAK